MTSRPPPDDDERTVWPGAPHPAGSADAGHALPAGALIEGYRITHVLGEGGFGIVYLAWDVALDRPVAIKEYMPSALAVRTHASFGVSARSEQYRDTFEAGLKSFLNEARLLARFDHPALVKVFRFWEANRTAYMVMPYYEGPTLKAALAKIGGPVPEAQLREWLKPLLDALAVIHREQCYHRDVSPDNILLTDGGPLLLDFGAARRVISDMTQALTAVLKPGYAPIEQYGGATAQGPWTDLYALAGVVHFAITGRPPLPSVERVVNDTQPLLATTHAGHYGDSFLRAIDTALSMRPEARPQDVAQFVAMLDVAPSPAASPVSSPAPVVEAPKTTSVFRRASKAVTERLSRTRNLTRTRASIPTPGQPPIAGPASRPATVKAAPKAKATLAAKATATAQRQAAPARGTGKAILAFAAAALLLAGGAAWWWKMRISSPPAASVPAAPEAVAPTEPAPEPQPTPAAIAAPPAPATAPPPAAERPAAPPPVAERPSTPEPAPAPTPSQAPVAEPPVASQAPASAARSRPARPPAAAVERSRPVASGRAVAESRPVPPSESPSTTTPNVGRRPARCSDIVLKSSMESLSPEEVAFLKRECR
ncbi:protein kinase [Variovorax robiniae]|uniref:non-specific serine/threonine protein kinase n=1 Tax=Variovorax robiniae TaxID=1836199 RepID=A0ABU8X3X1_9BURK